MPPVRTDVKASSSKTSPLATFAARLESLVTSAAASANQAVEQRDPSIFIKRKGENRSYRQPPCCEVEDRKDHPIFQEIIELFEGKMKRTTSLEVLKSHRAVKDRLTTEYLIWGSVDLSKEGIPCSICVKQSKDCIAQVERKYGEPLRIISSCIWCRAKSHQCDLLMPPRKVAKAAGLIEKILPSTDRDDGIEVSCAVSPFDFGERPDSHHQLFTVACVIRGIIDRMKNLMVAGGHADPAMGDRFKEVEEAVKSAQLFTGDWDPLYEPVGSRSVLDGLDKVLVFGNSMRATAGLGEETSTKLSSTCDLIYDHITLIREAVTQWERANGVELQADGRGLFIYD